MNGDLCSGDGRAGKQEIIGPEISSGIRRDEFVFRQVLVPVCAETEREPQEAKVEEDVGQCSDQGTAR